MDLPGLLAEGMAHRFLLLEQTLQLVFLRGELVLQVMAAHLEALRVLSIREVTRSAPRGMGRRSEAKPGTWDLGPTFSSSRSFSFLICASISSYK